MQGLSRQPWSLRPTRWSSPSSPTSPSVDLASSSTGRKLTSHQLVICFSHPTILATTRTGERRKLPPCHIPKNSLDTTLPITVGPQSRIALTFRDLAVEEEKDCPYDWVAIMDVGSGRFLVNRCLLVQILSLVRWIASGV